MQWSYDIKKSGAVEQVSFVELSKPATRYRYPRISASSPYEDITAPQEPSSGMTNQQAVVKPEAHPLPTYDLQHMSPNEIMEAYRAALNEQCMSAPTVPSVSFVKV